MSDKIRWTATDQVVADNTGLQAHNSLCLEGRPRSALLDVGAVGSHSSASRPCCNCTQGNKLRHTICYIDIRHLG
jgi:hypothetical protein